MQHDLVECDQGRREPDDLPLIRRLLALALAAALGLVAQGCAAGERGPIVLVSGRDDHGQVRQAAIGLQRSPDDATFRGSVPDGTFVRVLGRRGQWLEVRSFAAPPEEGWVNDFHIRGVAVRTDQPQQVSFLDAAVRGGVLMVRVRPVTAGTDPGEWVAAASLREVGGGP